jgi:F0F1-type ATP synthase assembly protein I
MYAEDKVKGSARLVPSQSSLNQSHGSFELVLSPVILALLGYLLDRQLGTGPWIMVVAAIVGLIGATTKLVIQYKAKMAEHEANAPWKPTSSPGVAS